MKHPTQINKYDGSFQDLINDISNLRYDVLASFLGELAIKIGLDGHADEKKGYKKLSEQLKLLSSILISAKQKTDTIWNICKKHAK